VPRDILPSDYGGNVKSLAELHGKKIELKANAAHFFFTVKRKSMRAKKLKRHL